MIDMRFDCSWHGYLGEAGDAPFSVTGPKAGPHHDFTINIGGGLGGIHLYLTGSQAADLQAQLTTALAKVQLQTMVAEHWDGTAWVSRKLVWDGTSYVPETKA